jgi:hypothetical protein
MRVAREDLAGTMPARPTLEIHQASLQCSARLRVPSLRLATVDNRVAEELLEKLAPFGAQVENLSIVPSPQNLASSSLTMYFLGAQAWVQLSPAGAEIGFQGSPAIARDVPLILPEAELRTILDAVETVVVSTTEQPRFATYTFTLAFHARLHEQSAHQFLQSFVHAAPTVLGDAREIGIRYTFGPAGSRLSSWIGAEPSLTIQPDGLFVNCGVSVDGGQVRFAEAATAAREYLRSVVESADCPVSLGHD